VLPLDCCAFWAWEKLLRPAAQPWTLTAAYSWSWSRELAFLRGWLKKGHFDAEARNSRGSQRKSKDISAGIPLRFLCIAAPPRQNGRLFKQLLT
ncbi:MAG: hypothetical protein WAU00_23380, partial [Caldilinea sp.]